jgi:hypothetical protein
MKRALNQTKEGTTKMGKSVLALAVIGILAAPLHAQTCATDAPVSGGSHTCIERLTDTGFNNGYSCWDYGTYSSAPGTRPDGNKVAELYGPLGRVSQTISIPSNADPNTSMAFSSWTTGSTQGSERLYVEIITTSGTDVIDVLYPPFTQNDYSYNLSNYAGQTITVRFRDAAGTSPGNTTFQIDNVALWTCN